MNRSEIQQVYLYQVILSYSIFSFYLPNLQSFKTGETSFMITPSLSLSSNSIQFYFSIYLPNLQSFETGDESFSESSLFSILGISIKLDYI